MAISRLNSFFSKHHRIIFGVFSVIIIIAFTDFLTPGTGIIDAFRGNGYNQSAGEIFGKKVSYSELNDQVRLDMLAMRIFMNMQVNQSMQEQIEMRSFYNLAQLEAAKQANVLVSDEEVGRFLRNFFRDEAGKFNLESYRNFVSNFLTAEGFNEDDLNKAARQYLTLAKFQNARNAAVIVTEDELKKFYNMINEEYEVLIGNFNTADFAKSIKADDKALEAYFMQNRSKYVIPAQLQALVVEYDYNKYRSQAIKKINDKALKDFYEQNKQLFGKVKDGKFEIQEFDKVKNEVRSSAIAAAAKELAMNAAQQFAAAAYEAISNVQPEQRLNVFKKQLAAAKLQAKATGRFSADSKSAGAVAEPALVSELAGIFMDMPVSNAVAGTKAAYVGYVTEMLPSRPAELKEVKARVTADFIQLEAMRMASERANEVVAKLNAIAPANRVARVKAMTNPKFQAAAKFTLLNGSPELGYAASAVSDLLPGEIAEPVTKADGVQIIVLAARTAPAKAYKADPMLENMFRNYKSSMNQMQFNSYLLSNCKRYAQSAENKAVAE